MKIKFRAWDKENKEMSESFSLFDMDRDYCIPLTRSIDEDVIMQYTGLKDKNGVEIYEGDIVRSVVFDAFTKTNTADCLNEVKFFTDNHEECGYNLGEYDNYEVIGNIYENPELLEEFKES